MASDDDSRLTEGQSEAEAQSEATLMPWVWGGIGLIAIAGFIAWLVLWPATVPLRHPAAAAPAVKSGT